MSNDSGPFGDDPYRGSVYHEVGIGQCPRCDGSLMEDWRSLACPRGCGELLPRAELPGELSIQQLDACEPDVTSLIGRPFPPARCPLCRCTMEVRLHEGLVFDFCFDHGLWLDRGERAGFEDAFAAGRGPAARNERRTPRWREAVQRAVMLDGTTLLEPARPPDAAEREELAWLDGERVRLDDERD